MFALDTNALIYFFKGQGQVASILLSISPQDIAVPSLVVYELETGIAKSTHPQKRRRQLAELLAVITILPFGLKEARQAEAIRTDLEKAGTPIGPYDILIAATARANQATLVTRNTNEFGRITGLTVVDWF